MQRSRSCSWIPASALALGLTLVGCGDDGLYGGGDDDRGDIDAAPGAAVEEVDCATATPVTTITISDFAFTPMTVSLGSGEVVRWHNTGAAPHTVTSGDPGAADAGDAFDSESIAAGGSYCLRFGQAAEYQYFCEIHPAKMRDAGITVR
jgi:plastocyanin